jgi:hypothetical protein
MTVDELIANLGDLGEELSRPESILTEIGEQITSQMKASVPVDTGALRNSISYTISNDSIVINMLYYGPFQNYGVNGTESRGSNSVEFGVEPRPTSEPFYAFKTRRWGLRPQTFFNMETITNQITQAFLEDTTQNL